MYSFYKAYWLDDQLELMQKFNYISPILERMLKSYLFSSYYLSRDINGSKFNEMYEKEKVKINKVAEWSLG